MAAPSDLPPRPPLSPVRRGVLIAILVVIAAIGGGLWFTRTRDAINVMNQQIKQFRAADNRGATLIEQSGGDAIDSIKRLPDLLLPESATDVHFARQGQTRPIYWLRYAAPTADVESALRDSCFTLPLQSGYDPGFEYSTSADIVANLDWWTPRAEKDSTGGRCQPTGDVTFRVAVDTTSADARTVYLEISTGQPLTLSTPDVTP